MHARAGLHCHVWSKNGSKFIFTNSDWGPYSLVNSPKLPKCLDWGPEGFKSVKNLFFPRGGSQAGSLYATPPAPPPPPPGFER